MGPGLAFPLWSKPDTWAFFPLAARQVYRQGTWVSMMYRRGSTVCVHTCTPWHTPGSEYFIQATLSVPWHLHCPTP